ncbi:uncharacterized protein LOC132704272 [Cylas formicarius]|uniref:uncharacterized protein LOC132704272 n=1 Tax=Cylas formicarius TaxID=197179 RepID=UPI002958D855|nr:uncharacterized protein LOC132704272 [Cylas formicarius]
MRLKVVVRVRPMSQREKQCGSKKIVTVESNNLAITNIKVPEQNAGDSRERIRRFAFDYCFSEDTSQDQIFETVESIVGRSLKSRCHSCVLTYGQTSSGKTHTMMGFPHDPGLTPRLCRRIFKYFEEGAIGEEAARMKITVSYLEIYNEKVADLLSNDYQSTKVANLKVREHPKRGPYVEGLSEHDVSNDIELLERLEAGTAKRRVGFTSTNPKSSRSHSVFSVTCDGVKLHLVDLAGNERAGSPGYGPSRFREGANINKSLVALGNVISVLAEHSRPSTRNKFVPYRDSVLTWLLKDTLQGNSETVMIATISPSSSCYSETINTLRFGQRAKLIVYKPVAIEDPKERTIRELRAEIAKLRELLASTHQVSSIDCVHKQMTNDKLDNTECLTEIRDPKEEEQQESHERRDAYAAPTNLTPTKPEAFHANLHLVPTMEVTSSVTPHRPNTLSRMCSFDRTYSVDSENSKTFSSQESLQSPKHSKSTKSSSTTNSRESLPGTAQRRSSVSNFSVPTKQTSLTLKRQSINKSNPSLNKPNPSSSLKTITQRRILGSVQKNAEVVELKNVVPKVDTNRKALTKPRSHVVAAVTNRLYSKVNKKEASTSTENALLLKTSTPAKSRLRELTQRALKAYKNRHVETQTDNCTVLRLKEVGTDCTGLKRDLVEIKDASTSDRRDTRDVEVECTLLGGFIAPDVKTGLVLTRSCGVQATEERSAGVSFTKYLTENQANPIFADSVNINISHNYVNANRANSLSDESLNRQRQSFNTPDLISNHNSLEQHPSPDTAEIKESSKVCFAMGDLLEDASEQVEVSSEMIRMAKAGILETLDDKYHLTKVDVLSAHAAEIQSNVFRECCVAMKDFLPDLVNATLVKIEEPEYCPVIIRQPAARQSSTTILLEPKIFNSSSESSLDLFSDVAESVVFHKGQSSKKSKSKNERLITAMSNFMEEATTLMKNLTKTASQLEIGSHRHCFEDCNLRVTVNDIEGLDEIKRRRKKAVRESSSTQTEQPSRESCCSQTSDDFLDLIVPINKYEVLLQDSCKRLEEKINKISRPVSVASADCEHQLHEHFSRAKYWDLSNLEVEDSSLESNPVTFSDYGSLPRKTYKRRRTPTCSPSAFLKQLTNMRKRVIESSREELLHSSGKQYE